MSDIIQLLPDSVANQIAAGEVIQRPASAVKELMENAIDAGATSIKLIIKDAGRTLIQVIDNGSGMSETDARLSFERHATSKIRKAEDLFEIRTMGFRGEALASIAAVAQVELKTKKKDEELGTFIRIEGSEVKEQTVCACADGTSFSIKNLFYNIPARRTFLKSNPVETKHILDEFERVALAHPEIAFSMDHNDNMVYSLKNETLPQRILGLYGANYKERLVPVEESTTIMNITGYVCKPEFAKKTRGEQFFFINQRFVKDGYLNHAVNKAFEELLPSDSFASYFLFIEIDPAQIDINIHPTKTEIKFQDDKSVYAIMKASVKRALGHYNIVPVLDFNQETSFNIPLHRDGYIPKEPVINVNRDYNPFKASPSDRGYTPDRGYQHKPQGQKEWQPLYEGLNDFKVNTQERFDLPEPTETEAHIEKSPIQLHSRYIGIQVKTGLMLIDQQAAHERILYEKYLDSLEENKGNSQQQLFPQTVELSTADFELVRELKSEINALGFDLSEFGKNTFAINGIPTDLNNFNGKELIENLIEQFKNNSDELKLDKRENLARSLARNTAIKPGKYLGEQEMKRIIDELFACSLPYVSLSGGSTIYILNLEELGKKFEGKN